MDKVKEGAIEYLKENVSIELGITEEEIERFIDENIFEVTLDEEYRIDFSRNNRNILYEYSGIEPGEVVVVSHITRHLELWSETRYEEDIPIGYSQRIFSLLLDRGGFTLKRISEELDVGEQYIESDLNFLVNSGVAIKIEDTYRLNQKLLNNNILRKHIQFILEEELKDSVGKIREIKEVIKKSILSQLIQTDLKHDKNSFIFLRKLWVAYYDRAKKIDDKVLFAAESIIYNYFQDQILNAALTPIGGYLWMYKNGGLGDIKIDTIKDKIDFWEEIILYFEKTQITSLYKNERIKEFIESKIETYPSYAKEILMLEDIPEDVEAVKKIISEFDKLSPEQIKIIIDRYIDDAKEVLQEAQLEFAKIKADSEGEAFDEEIYFIEKIIQSTYNLKELWTRYNRHENINDSALILAEKITYLCFQDYILSPVLGAFSSSLQRYKDYRKEGREFSLNVSLIRGVIRECEEKISHFKDKNIEKLSDYDEIALYIENLIKKPDFAKVLGIDIENISELDRLTPTQIKTIVNRYISDLESTVNSLKENLDKIEANLEEADINALVDLLDQIKVFLPDEIGEYSFRRSKNAINGIATSMRTIRERSKEEYKDIVDVLQERIASAQGFNREDLLREANRVCGSLSSEGLVDIRYALENGGAFSKIVFNRMSFPEFLKQIANNMFDWEDCDDDIKNSLFDIMVLSRAYDMVLMEAKKPGLIVTNMLDIMNGFSVVWEDHLNERGKDERIITLEKVLSHFLSDFFSNGIVMAINMKLAFYEEGSIVNIDGIRQYLEDVEVEKIIVHIKGMDSIEKFVNDSRIESSITYAIKYLEVTEEDIKALSGLSAEQLEKIIDYYVQDLRTRLDSLKGYLNRLKVLQEKVKIEKPSRDNQRSL